MPAPKDVHDFLTDSHPGLAALALWVREAVLAGEPDLTERVYLGWEASGSGIPTPAMCAPSTHASRTRSAAAVRAWRPPGRPRGLLEGAGTQTRFIRVWERDDRLAAAIGWYVHAAVAERLFRR
jgi:hypothetical protein